MQRFDYTQMISLKNVQCPSDELFEELSSLLARNAGSHSNAVLISERKAADFFGISRSAVHKAYERLFSRGILSRSDNSTSYRITNFNQSATGQCVGIVVPMAMGEYLADSQATEARIELFAGIIDRASLSGLGIRMLNLPPPSSSKREIGQYMRENMPSIVGILHLGERGFSCDAPLEAIWSDIMLPQVIILAKNKYAHCGRVSFDDGIGISAVGRHFRELGHKNLAVFFPDEDRHIGDGFVYALSNIRDIHEAFFNSWMNLPKNAVFFFNTKRILEDIERAIDDMLKLQPRPSAIWCRNDYSALGVIAALRKRGFRVPEDFSVIGMDDIAEAGKANLTTLKLPFYEIGKRSVEMLLDIRSKRTAYTERVANVSPVMIVRKTTAENRYIK